MPEPAVDPDLDGVDAAARRPGDSGDRGAAGRDLLQRPGTSIRDAVLIGARAA